MINIEQIKEYIKCPQFGDLEYGKWGALRLEQRIAYKELIEEIERLRKKYENAVADYDSEHYKVVKAIAYIKAGKTFYDIEVTRIIDKYEKNLLNILEGSGKE